MTTTERRSKTDKLVVRVINKASQPKLLQFLTEGGYDFVYYSSENAETKERDRKLPELLKTLDPPTQKRSGS